MLTIDYVRQGSVCFSTTHPDEPTLANIEMLQIAKQRIIDEDFDGPRTWGNVKIEPEYAHDRTNFQLVDESDIDALLAALPRCSYGDEEFAVIDGMCHEHARARDNRDDEQIQADREEDL